jgi:hypothetical protein
VTEEIEAVDMPGSEDVWKRIGQSLRAQHTRKRRSVLYRAAVILLVALITGLVSGGNQL